MYKNTRVLLCCVLAAFRSRGHSVLLQLRTGIAAANVEIEKTDVAATTIHNTFEFDGEYKSRLDFSKLTSIKVAELMMLEVLLLDETVDVLIVQKVYKFDQIRSSAPAR